VGVPGHIKSVAAFDDTQRNMVLLLYYENWEQSVLRMASVGTVVVDMPQVGPLGSQTGVNSDIMFHVRSGPPRLHNDCLLVWSGRCAQSNVV